jgi:hypothetical protein
MKRTFTAIAAVALVGGAAHAVTPDSESLVILLNGEIESNCELAPEGTTSFAVDMEDYGNQGTLAIAYSCNSPYTVTLQSLNGGMEHESGLLNLEYDIEHIGWDQNGINGGSVNSAAMQAAPVEIANSPNWENIVTNLGVRTGNLDLNLPPFSEQAVAGEYEDELTLTLTAVL